MENQKIKIINKDKLQIKEYNKKYYQEHKLKRQEQYLKRVNCPNCNKDLSCGRLKKHLELKICLSRKDLIEQLNNKN